jgi:hypothetical protein
LCCFGHAQRKRDESKKDKQSAETSGEGNNDDEEEEMPSETKAEKRGKAKAKIQQKVQEKRAAKKPAAAASAAATTPEPPPSDPLLISVQRLFILDTRAFIRAFLDKNDSTGDVTKQTPVRIEVRSALLHSRVSAAATVRLFVPSPITSSSTSKRRNVERFR